MGTVLGKECYVFHIEDRDGETQVNWIDSGKVRYGDYKVYIYRDNEIYYKESIENIYVKKSGNIVLLCTRDNKTRFEIVLKDSMQNTQIVDLGFINSILSRNCKECM